MKLGKIVSLVKSNINQFVKATDDAFVDKKVKSLIQDHRALSIESRYIKDRRIHPDWLQPYTPVYDPTLQYSDEFTLFSFFPVIDLDGRHDGCIYVGSPECQQQFRRCLTRGEWANRKHIKELNGRVIHYMIEDLLLKIEVVKGIKVTKPDTECIFSSPVKLPGFNEFEDDYPIDEGGIPLIVESIYKEYSHPTLASGTLENRKEDKVI